jgi:hypothetical protein
METHYFRARVDQMVSGMDDTAIAAVQARSLREAVDKALEQHLGNDDFYVFTDEMWPNRGGEDEPRRPSTGPVHYLGTEETVRAHKGAVLLSEVEGRKVVESEID